LQRFAEANGRTYLLSAERGDRYDQQQGTGGGAEGDGRGLTSAWWSTEEALAPRRRTPVVVRCRRTAGHELAGHDPGHGRRRGVTFSGAKPVSVGTLSSAVWRARVKGREANGAREQQRLGPAPIPLSGHPRKSTVGRAIGQTRQGKRKASPQNGDGAQVDRPAAKRSAGGDRLGQANKDVLGFMDRARAVRRRSEDD